jgi:hypothetical protein
MTTNPSAAASERARAIQLPFPCGCLDAHSGGGVSVGEYTCDTHRAIASELSAKDAEIERLTQDRNSWRRVAERLESEKTTARADAIREWRNAIEQLAASFKHSAWKGFNQEPSQFEDGYKHAMGAAATALESLLNEETK